MSEIWREIPGYGGWYEASSEGRIRSWIPTGRKPYGPLARRATPRVLSPAPNRFGYLMVALKEGLRWRSRTVHILVAESFHGERPLGKVVCHNNGIKGDNCAVNLRWDTQSENIRESFRHGTHKPNNGELNGNAKINASHALEIRKQRAKGRTLQSLAEAYGMSKSGIKHIVDGRVWKHI